MKNLNLIFLFCLWAPYLSKALTVGTGTFDDPYRLSSKDCLTEPRDSPPKLEGLTWFSFEAQHPYVEIYLKSVPVSSGPSSELFTEINGEWVKIDEVGNSCTPCGSAYHREDLIPGNNYKFSFEHSSSALSVCLNNQPSRNIWQGAYTIAASINNIWQSSNEKLSGNNELGEFANCGSRRNSWFKFNASFEQVKVGMSSSGNGSIYLWEYDNISDAFNPTPLQTVCGVSGDGFLRYSSLDTSGNITYYLSVQNGVGNLTVDFNGDYNDQNYSLEIPHQHGWTTEGYPFKMNDATLSDYSAFQCGLDVNRNRWFQFFPRNSAEIEVKADFYNLPQQANVVWHVMKKTCESCVPEYVFCQEGTGVHYKPAEGLDLGAQYLVSLATNFNSKFNLAVNYGAFSYWNQLGNDLFYSEGNVSIGKAPDTREVYSHKLTVTGDVKADSLSISDDLKIKSNANGDIHFVTDGFVGIGPANMNFEGNTEGYMLVVPGKIGSHGVKIENSSEILWPDYVFNEEYSAMSISEIEDYIRENKHLPEIPSQEDYQKDGLEVDVMISKLLKKIEELTLYTIQQQHQIDSLIRSRD